jgi:uncharacterized protein
MEEIVNKVESYCTTLLEQSSCNTLPFHNIVHTREVVKNTVNILTRMKLSSEESEPLVIAAWFHDTGFSKKYKGHEDVSINLAKTFLSKHQYPPRKIDVVIECIEATKMPQNPKTELAKVLCDADLFHVGTPNFFYRKQLLRKEWENEFNKQYTDMEWHQLNLVFLQEHEFFTDYGKKRLKNESRENIEKLKNLISICESNACGKNFV